MSTNSEHELQDDPRLTAYALGELEGDDAAQVAALVEADPALRAAVAGIRAAGEVLGAELCAEGSPGLTDAQRRAIESRTDGTASARRARTLPVRAFAALGLAAAVIAAVAISLRPVQQALGRADSAAPFTYTIFGDPAPVARRVARTSGEVDYRGRPEVLFEAQLASRHELMPRLDASGRARDDTRRTLAQLGYTDEIGAVELQLVPAEGHDTEAYDPIVENAFQLARDEPLSTFSIDVDTASYANVRRFLDSGQLPPPDAVRIEELVNYFPYDYAPPTGDAPFAVHVETAGCPWAPRHRLLRVGLKGRELGEEGRKPSNLVFLLDVSGSMNSAAKLPLLKRALSLLVQELDERDRVAVVVYAGAAGLVLPSTPAVEKWQILEALEKLEAGGSTAGGAGIELAYEVAASHFIEGGMNRVILATDGDFNVGVSDDGSLVRLVEEKRESGVFLSVLGFGTGNVKDSKMEKLADHGNGSYAYIDSLLEARKVLVEELGATLETIAKDVKIQVEFNPLQVEAWRLVGYENRLLAAQDFNDDTKDAGEIGAGHTVTALYELVPAGQGIAVPGVDPLRYQTPPSPSPQAYSGELGLLKLRYKQPDSDTSRLIQRPVSDEGGAFGTASEDLRFASAVAGFGMCLRGSAYCGTLKLEGVRALASDGIGDDVGGYRAQFLELVRRAAELERAAAEADDERR